VSAVFPGTARRPGRFRPPAVPLAALTVALCLELTGCAGPSAPSVPSDASEGSMSDGPGTAGSTSCPIPLAPVAAAVGGRANTPAPTVPARLASVITKAITATPAGSTSPPLTLIRLDGRSDQTTSSSFFSDAANAEAYRQDQSTFLSSFEAATAATRAAVPEANDLAALAIAARAARDPRTGTGTVVLLDGGLSTAPPLDFSVPGVLDSDPDELVNSLQAQHAVPDLSGLTVIFIGIGDVAFPSAQAPLDPARHRGLVDFYVALAKKGNAACTEVVPIPRSGLAPTDVPPVRLVPVPPPTVLDLHDPRPSILPNDHMTGFRPDTAVLLNPPGARDVLRPLAAALASDPRQSVLLSGTTANVGPVSGQKDVGRARAETVKAVLVDLGAQPTQITAEGLGSDFPQHVPEYDPQGHLLPGPAQANRSVRITPRATHGPS
jgi:OOP family OmpA-OmpF porin